MSDNFISIETIKSVEVHPNADKLEIAKVLGTQCVVPKGQFQAGQSVVYFPPDMMLPADVSAELGVANYLKHGIIEGQKIPCRVAACRLRSVASFGFVVAVPDDLSAFVPGDAVSTRYRAVKYEPPVHNHGGPNAGGKVFAGEAPDHPMFHRYTDIQNYYRYPDAIPTGTPVRVTEKIHGTNSRVGVILQDGEFQFMAGSHKRNRLQEWEGTPDFYWKPFEIEGVMDALNTLCDERRNIVIFGELYGPSVQDMDYGVPAGDWGYRVFDITDDGDYLDWDTIKAVCNNCQVELVPLLYTGPFSQKMVEALTDGPTTLSDPKGIKSAYKGREGVVITPLVEAYSDVLGGRMVLKSKSADYIGRKGAQDNA